MTLICKSQMEGGGGETNPTHTLKEMKVDMDYGVSFFILSIFFHWGKKEDEENCRELFGYADQDFSFSGRQGFLKMVVVVSEYVHAKLMYSI